MMIPSDKKKSNASLIVEFGSPENEEQEKDETEDGVEAAIDDLMVAIQEDNKDLLKESLMALIEITFHRYKSMD